MKSKRYTVLKQVFGYKTDCVFEVRNSNFGAVIEVFKCDYPTLINKDLIAHLVNRFRGDYSQFATAHNIKEIANGWLKDDIKDLEEKLEEMKFLQRVASRNLLKVVDSTEVTND